MVSWCLARLLRRKSLPDWRFQSRNKTPAPRVLAPCSAPATTFCLQPLAGVLLCVTGRAGRHRGQDLLDLLHAKRQRRGGHLEVGVVGNAAVLALKELGRAAQ